MCVGGWRWGASSAVLMRVTIDISLKGNVHIMCSIVSNSGWVIAYFGFSLAHAPWMNCGGFFIPFTSVRGSHRVFIPSVFIFLWHISPRLPACQLSLPWSEDISYRLHNSYGGPSFKTQQTGRKMPLKLGSVLQINVSHTRDLYNGSVVPVKPINHVQQQNAYSVTSETHTTTAVTAPHF